MMANISRFQFTLLRKHPTHEKVIDSIVLNPANTVKLVRLTVNKDINFDEHIVNIYEHIVNILQNCQHKN